MPVEIVVAHEVHLPSLGSFMCSVSIRTSGRVELNDRRPELPALKTRLKRATVAGMAFGRLELRLCGELSVLHDGERVELPASKKTRALLAYLVVTGRAHTRERLCELLWGDVATDPRAQLRWSLWKLRPLLDDGRTQRLVATRDQVAFEPHGADVDVTRSARLLTPGLSEVSTDQLRELAASLRGELGEGLELPDSFRFAEWLAAEREVVRSRQLLVLDALVSRLSSQPDEALIHARARLAIDPLIEEAHATVVTLLGRAGRMREATAQLEAAQRILGSELGAKPSAPLDEARRSLAALTSASRKAQTAPAPKAEDSGVAQERIDQRLPLLGRQAELRAVEAALASGRVSLIVGDPGIGKSRLVDEVAARAAARGLRVVRCRGHETDRGRAYGPLIDASIALVDDPRPDAIASAIGDRDRLWRSINDQLGAMAAAAPLMLIIDDVQWIDDASAALLPHLERGRCQLLLAARGGELTDHTAALRSVRALTRDGQLTQVQLGRLPRPAIADLAGRIDPAGNIAQICRASDGNPLYAVELARAGAQDSVVPKTLLELIGERFEQLDDEAQELSCWVAAFGRGVDIDALAAASGMAPLALGSALARLERRGLLRASDHGWDFEHDLVRQVAYLRTSSPRRKLIHRHIARALDALDDNEGSRASAVVHHATAGGEAALGARASLRAGERCLRLYAFADAEAFARQGCRHAEQLPTDERVELSIALLALVVHPSVRPRNPDELRHELTRLCVEAHDHGLRVAESRALIGLARLHYHAWRDAPRASAALAQAVAVLERNADAHLEPFLSGVRCLAIIHAQMPRVAMLFAELQALGPRATDSLYFQWGLGLVRRWQGDAVASATALRRAIAYARARNDHWAEFECTTTLVTLLLETGTPADAAAMELLAVARKLQGGSEGAHAAALVVLAGFAEGAAPAWGALDVHVTALTKVDAGAVLASVHTIAAQCALARRDLVRARNHADRALAVAERAGSSIELARAQTVSGQVAIVEGHRSEAAQAFAKASRMGDDLPAALRDIVTAGA